MVGAQPQSSLPGEGVKCRTRISQEMCRGCERAFDPVRRARTEGQEAKRPRHAAGVRLARRGWFGRCPIGDWAFWNVRYRIEANLPKPPRDQPDQNLFRAPLQNITDNNARPAEKPVTTVKIKTYSQTL